MANIADPVNLVDPASKYTVSIIIPVLNEATVIYSTIKTLQQNPDAPKIELIVVDGGSQDLTVEIAQQMNVKAIEVIGKGRAAQMNAGANIAQGKILLFLHADTLLPSNFLTIVKQTLDQPGVIAGAFELAISGQERSLRWLEKLVKIRSNLLSLPYGDQAIFIKKSMFMQLGGYADLPIMEDFELIQRLKCQGQIAIAPAQVVTSGRRWQKLGVWRVTLINQLVIAGYYLGISPRRLANLYRHPQQKIDLDPKSQL